MTRIVTSQSPTRVRPRGRSKVNVLGAVGAAVNLLKDTAGEATRPALPPPTSPAGTAATGQAVQPFYLEGDVVELVTAVSNDWMPRCAVAETGTEATVVAAAKSQADPSLTTYLLDFGEGFQGHDGGNRAETETCLWAFPERFKIKRYRAGAGKPRVAVAAATPAASASGYGSSYAWTPKRLRVTPPERDVSGLSVEPIYTLYQMLRYRRPKGGPTEEAFIIKFLDDLPGITLDPFGNLYTVVGDKPDVLWSSHTDSVHGTEGMQNIHIDGDWIMLSKKSKKASSCLGADCAAGVWIMREMILAGVPGVYVFHYGEESGGIGSGALAKNNPDFFKGIKAAIAFDRWGYDSIITHQWGGRCCSQAFVDSLAQQLPGFKADSGGTFTDTANYTELVPECTNISVGYFDQHSDDEAVHIPHLLWLRERMLAIDTSKLVIARDPNVLSYEADDYEGWGYYSRYAGYRSVRSAGYAASSTGPAAGRQPPAREIYATKRKPRSLAELLSEYPNECAAVLDHMGIEAQSLIDEIESAYGIWFE